MSLFSSFHFLFAHSWLKYHINNSFFVYWPYILQPWWTHSFLKDFFLLIFWICHHIAFWSPLVLVISQPFIILEFSYMWWVLLTDFFQYFLFIFGFHLFEYNISESGSLYPYSPLRFLGAWKCRLMFFIKFEKFSFFIFLFFLSLSISSVLLVLSLNMFVCLLVYHISWKL